MMHGAISGDSEMEVKCLDQVSAFRKRWFHQIVISGKTRYSLVSGYSFGILKYRKSKCLLRREICIYFF